MKINNLDKQEVEGEVVKRLNGLYLIPFILALAAGMTGCVTKQGAEQAMVCPDCKMVEGTEQHLDSSEGGPVVMTTTPRMEHNCPNCQGAIKTFFKEGKLQHKCSVCTQDAFVCPVGHRML